MKQERADEIVRKVFYANFRIMPDISNSENAFHVGRMLGTMQKVLEIELAKEVNEENASAD